MAQPDQEAEQEARLKRLEVAEFETANAWRSAYA
jgi:hypothetical protein